MGNSNSSTNPQPPTVSAPKRDPTVVTPWDVAYGNEDLHRKQAADKLVQQISQQAEAECKACSGGEASEAITSIASSSITQPCPAYANSSCPLNRKELGRSTWAFLHTMAAYYPQKPTPREQIEMIAFMDIFSRIYPCGYCADTTAEAIKVTPPRVRSQKEFSQWMCEIHNEVNERIGKPVFDCSKVEERWKNGPADGSCDRKPK